ncbi:hypothetical protein, partial [Enterobacter asburiae]|uniref:hypothetical protein n=1 Tax=Enterobacter asburiae TaxID=61645 RepID=UPI0013D866F3
SQDDWLKRGIRSDAADLYRQQDLNVTLEHDFWGSSGTGGYSDFSLWKELGQDIGASVLTRNTFGMTGFSPGAKL